MAINASSFRSFHRRTSADCYEGVKDDNKDDIKFGVCTCHPNGSYFVTQNTFGNFLGAVPPSVNKNTSDDENLDQAASLLAEEFMSSAVTCQRIQDYYKQCSWLETEPRYSFWLVNCKTWETLISDPTYGIYCDLETILKVDSAHNHDYQSATIHPYGRRRGIIIAFWLQEWSTYRVLIENRLVCNEPDCSECLSKGYCDRAYNYGGLFVTHQAKRLLFEGYVDRVAMALLNSELQYYNLSVRCQDHSTIKLDEYCNPVENNECTDGGFEIIDRLGVSRKFQHNGRHKRDWYLPEIILNPTNISHYIEPKTQPKDTMATLSSRTLTIENPAFAIYPGKLWAPDVTINLRRGCEGDEVCKFHQETDCVNRFLGGKGKWQNCTSTLVTGKNNLNDVQRVAEWRGNTSLITGNEFVLRGPA